MGYNDEFDRDPNLPPEDESDFNGDQDDDLRDELFADMDDDASGGDDDELSWLDDDSLDDEDDDKTPDDESSEPAWLKSTSELYDEDPDETPEWLSITGMLDADEPQSTEDEPDNEPDWLPDTNMLIGDEGSETDEPDWLADTNMLVGDEAGDDDPDWLAQSEGGDEAAWTEDDDPDWLTEPEMSGAEPQSEADDDDAEWLSDEDPDWMLQGAGDLTDDTIDESFEEPADDDMPEMPSWLEGMDAEADDSGDYDDEADEDEPDWLDEMEVPRELPSTSQFDDLFEDIELESTDDLPEIVSEELEDEPEEYADSGELPEMSDSYLREMGLESDDEGQTDEYGSEDWLTDAATDDLENAEWLSEIEVDEPSPEAEPVAELDDAAVGDDDAGIEDELLAALDEQTGGEEFEDEAIDLDELIASLDEGDTEDEDVDLDELLQEIGEEPDTMPADAADFDEGEIEDYESMFDSLDVPEAQQTEEAFDIDSILDDYEDETADEDAQFSAIQAMPSDDDDDLPFDDDFDAVPAGEVFGGDDEDLPDLPDWLKEAQQDDAREGSVVAELLGKEKDRSVEELDDRLRTLRETGLGLTAEQAAGATTADEDVLPDPNQALAPAAVTATLGAAAVSSDLVMTPEQRKHADVVSSITSGASAALAEDELPEVQRRRIITPAAVVRVVLTLVLLAAVVIPFLTQIQFGDQPAVVFGADSPGAAAYDYVEGMTNGDYVLVAAEYGPSAAGELDAHTRNVLTHIIEQGAVPVIVSSNVTGLLRAETIAGELAPDAQNSDIYHVIRYLPAGTIGLRDLSRSTASVVQFNAQGQPTELSINTLADFAGGVLITDSAETVRAWMEQVAPSAPFEFVVATGYAGEPFTVPYTVRRGSIAGLLAGYEDAMIYRSMLAGIEPTTSPPTETPTPEATATEEPATATDEPTGAPTDEPTDDADVVPPVDVDATEEDATPEDTAQPTEIAATNTPQPTDTEQPTDTATPTATATATRTPTATLTPSPTPIPTITVATNNLETRINVREVPDGLVVGVVEPGQTVRVLDEDDESGWIQIELPDETVGWVFGNLLDIEEILETEFEERQSSSLRPQRQFASFRLQQDEPPVTGETEADEPAMQNSDTEPEEVAAVAVTDDDTEARWNAITLGTLAAAIIILLGNAFYLVRWLLRRGS